MLCVGRSSCLGSVPAEEGLWVWIGRMPQEGSGGEDGVGVRSSSWQTPECVRLLWRERTD